MWSPRHRREAGRRLRLAAALLLAGTLAACFQPLYGERTLTGAPGMRTALAGVQVAQIEAPAGTAQARLAVEMRNELLFHFTGGEAGLPPTHRLIISLAVGGSTLIVDPTTARPEFEVTSLDATYRLVDVATSKQVFDGTATARVSYDIPGQQQRFLKLRGQRDAESRAVKVVAEQIRNRLASFFTAGT